MSAGLPLNTIIHGDCRELLRQLPSGCADVVFADPPYNLQLKEDLYRPNATQVNGVTDNWDKFSSFEEYDDFTIAWMKECKRVLKPGGAMWVIGSYHNIFRLGHHLQNLGFWLLNDIVWIKSNPMPNFKGTRFNNAHETLIWAIPSAEARYTFHYHSLKAMNDDLQMRSDWYFPICTGSERIKINGSKAHSTQKPAELLYRILLATSNAGDLVIDPFSGSGTTAAVAKLLNRNFIAFEQEEKYVAVSRERLDRVIPLAHSVTAQEINSKKPRLPLGALLEGGLLTAGEIIVSADGKHSAVLNADGTIKCSGYHGSLHRVGGALTGRSTVNGWNYWCVVRNGNTVTLDVVRDEYIARTQESD